MVRSTFKFQPDLFLLTFKGNFILPTLFALIAAQKAASTRATLENSSIIQCDLSEKRIDSVWPQRRRACAYRAAGAPWRPARLLETGSAWRTVARTVCVSVCLCVSSISIPPRPWCYLVSVVDKGRVIPPPPLCPSAATRPALHGLSSCVVKCLDTVIGFCEVLVVCLQLHSGELDQTKSSLVVILI